MTISGSQTITVSSTYLAPNLIPILRIPESNSTILFRYLESISSFMTSWNSGPFVKELSVNYLNLISMSGQHRQVMYVDDVLGTVVTSTITPDPTSAPFFLGVASTGSQPLYNSVSYTNVILNFDANLGASSTISVSANGSTSLSITSISGGSMTIAWATGTSSSPILTVKAYSLDLSCFNFCQIPFTLVPIQCLSLTVSPWFTQGTACTVTATFNVSPYVSTFSFTGTTIACSNGVTYGTYFSGAGNTSLMFTYTPPNSGSFTFTFNNVGGGSNSTCVSPSYTVAASGSIHSLTLNETASYCYASQDLATWTVGNYIYQSGNTTYVGTIPAGSGGMTVIYSCFSPDGTLFAGTDGGSRFSIYTRSGATLALIGSEASTANGVEMLCMSNNMLSPSNACYVTVGNANNGWGALYYYNGTSTFSLLYTISQSYIAYNQSISGDGTLAVFSGTQNMAPTLLFRSGTGATATYAATSLSGFNNLTGSNCGYSDAQISEDGSTLIWVGDSGYINVYKNGGSGTWTPSNGSVSLQPASWPGGINLGRSGGYGNTVSVNKTGNEFICNGSGGTTYWVFTYNGSSTWSSVIHTTSSGSAEQVFMGTTSSYVVFGGNSALWYFPFPVPWTNGKGSGVLSTTTNTNDTYTWTNTTQCFAYISAGTLPDKTYFEVKVLYASSWGNAYTSMGYGIESSLASSCSFSNHYMIIGIGTGGAPWPTLLVPNSGGNTATLSAGTGDPLVVGYVLGFAVCFSAGTISFYYYNGNTLVSTVANFVFGGTTTATAANSVPVIGNFSNSASTSTGSLQIVSAQHTPAGYTAIY